MTYSLTIAVALLHLLMPICSTQTGELGPGTTLQAAEFAQARGGTYRLPGGEESQATVLVFFGSECPMSNGYVPEINRLCKEFTPKKIAFCVVYADADLKAPDAAKHAKEYGFACPAILDPNLTLAQRYGATIKPEVAVISPEQKLLYRGRIDDRYVDFGKQRAQPTVRELRDALEAILADKPIAVPRTKAIGCDIDFPAIPKQK